MAKQLRRWRGNVVMNGEAFGGVVLCDDCTNNPAGSDLIERGKCRDCGYDPRPEFHFRASAHAIADVARFLAQRSAWFAMEPWPDDEWRVEVKPETAVVLRHYLHDRGYAAEEVAFGA